MDKGIMLLSIAATLSCGCASVYHRTPLSESHVQVFGDITRRKPYPGVRGDANALGASAREFGGAEHWSDRKSYVRHCFFVSGLMVVYTVDLPLSAVVDTALLPIDLWRFRDCNPDEQENQPAPGAYSSKSADDLTENAQE